MSNIKRSKSFATLCYLESTDKVHLISFLDSLHISYLISPLHDSDLDDSGELKKAHWHIILNFDSLKSVPQVKDLLSFSDSYAISFVGLEMVNSLVSYARYLCHLDNPDKAQYPLSDVISYGIDYYSLVSEKNDRFNAFCRTVDYVLDNHITSFSKLIIYARSCDPDMLHSLMDNSFTIREFIRSFAMDSSRNLSR